jgi:hypothetical protein
VSWFSARPLLPSYQFKGGRGSYGTSALLGGGGIPGSQMVSTDIVTVVLITTWQEYSPGSLLSIFSHHTGGVVEVRNSIRKPYYSLAGMELAGIEL